MTAAHSLTNDFYRGTDIQAATTPQVFALLGGKYGIICLAAVWGGGNVELQGMGPDDSTYVKWGTQITANGTQALDLPPGRYKFVVTTTNAVYVAISRIRP